MGSAWGWGGWRQRLGLIGRDSDEAEVQRQEETRPRKKADIKSSVSTVCGKRCLKKSRDGWINGK